MLSKEQLTAALEAEAAKWLTDETSQHDRAVANAWFAGGWEAAKARIEQALAKITEMHRAKHGHGIHGPYVICAYDKTAWPCATQAILNGDNEGKAT